MVHIGWIHAKRNTNSGNSGGATTSAYCGGLPPKSYAGSTSLSVRCSSGVPPSLRPSASMSKACVRVCVCRAGWMGGGGIGLGSRCGMGETQVCPGNRVRWRFMSKGEKAVASIARLARLTRMVLGWRWLEFSGGG